MRRVGTTWTAALLGTASVLLGCSQERASSALPKASGVQASFTQLVMASPMRVTIDTQDARDARSAASAAFARAVQVENALSDWQPNSDVCRLPLTADKPTVVAADLAMALDRSSEVQKATEGAFDPALGALTRIWREARSTGIPPTEASIAQARARSGWSHVRWSSNTQTITFDCDGVRLDFGGIGKGLAATEALRAIEQRGCQTALVSLDGDIACGAAPFGRAGWRVDVDSGVDGDAGCTLCLTNCAVSTSGDREQWVDVSAHHLAHIIEPRSHTPRDGRFGVTVVAQNGAIADALATALAARPTLIERVSELRAALGSFEARLVTPESGSAEACPAHITVTSGWEALVAKDVQASGRSPAAAPPSANHAGTVPSGR